MIASHSAFEALGEVYCKALTVLSDRRRDFAKDGRNRDWLGKGIS